MPITDNTFTADELKAALSTNKETLMPLVKQVLGTEFKFVVRDETEEATFKNNLESAVISRKTSEHAQQLEKDVFEMTGIAKTNGDEKYYDYFKRATKAVADELKVLKEKSNPSEADKLRIQQLEDGLRSKTKEFTDKLKEKDTEIFKLKAGGEIEKAIAGFRANYKKDLPVSLIQLAEEKALNTLMAQAKIGDDGKISFYNEDGTLIQNPVDLSAEKAETLVKNFLTKADVLDTGKQQQGAGSGAAGATGGTGGGNGSFKFAGIPVEVKSRPQLTEYLLKNGLTDSEPEFTKILTSPEAMKLPLHG